MELLKREDVEHYKDFGYVHLKNVFSELEIKELRNAMEELCGEGKFTVPGDLLNYESVGKFVYDERMVQIAKSLIGDNITYFGDSGFIYGKNVFRGLHTDDPPNARSRYLNQNYGMVRIGIYPQDHSRFSGGLKLQEQTHKYFSIYQYIRNLERRIKQRFLSTQLDNEILPFPSIKHIRRCKLVNPKTQAGDVLAWDMRIIHSPQVVRLKIFSGLSLHPKIENYIPPSLKLPVPEKRSLLSVSFGIPSNQLDRHIKYLISRSDYRKHWDEFTWDIEKMKTFLEKRSVQLRLDYFQYKGE